MKKRYSDYYGLKQSPLRLHPNDHKALKAKVSLEGLTVQMLCEACIMAYLQGDERVKIIAKAYKAATSGPTKNLEWSEVEGENILNQLEALDSET
jgi:hypothetical protein